MAEEQPEAVHILDLKSTLRSIPKFDGKTNVDLFCARCDAILAAKGLDARLLLLNFHLILEGEVQDWWKWTQIKFITELTEANKNAKWEQLKTDLKLFYEPDCVRKEARKAAREIRFVDCVSAGEYVSKKLCHFGIMDPKMSDSKQVEKLIKGLPENLRNIMFGSEPKNATEFLQKLRKMERPEERKSNWNKNVRSEGQRTGRRDEPATFARNLGILFVTAQRPRLKRNRLHQESTKCPLTRLNRLLFQKTIKEGGKEPP